MPKNVYSVSSMVERNMGTKYLHPFSARERAGSLIQQQTVPWPIDGTIIAVELEMGTALAGTDVELAAAPLTAAIFKNEVLEATTVLTLSAFQTETTATVSISISAGDRISVRLMETTPGTTWRGFANYRFVFESLHRGNVIGGGTGTYTLSGATVGSWRMYPSCSDIDPFTDSGIARTVILADSEVSEFYVYRYPAIYSQFTLTENENELFTITVTGTQASSIAGDRRTAPEGTYLAMDLLSVSGLISISWSALLRSI